jgi:hypothetical protein
MSDDRPTVEPPDWDVPDWAVTDPVDPDEDTDE